jgi:hypothetical protein
MNMHDFEQPEIECNLAELLKPPAYRQSVEDLRAGQHLSRKNKLKYRIRTIKEFKSVPKSYFVAQARN